MSTPGTLQAIRVLQTVRLDGTQRVDWAPGHAVRYQRFGTGDLVSILTVGPVDEWIQATDIHSIQPSTKAWERFAGGEQR